MDTHGCVRVEDAGVQGDKWTSKHTYISSFSPILRMCSTPMRRSIISRSKETWGRDGDRSTTSSTWNIHPTPLPTEDKDDDEAAAATGCVCV